MSDTELSIEDIITDFGEVYREVKGTKTQDGWEKILKDAQKQFFDAATRELEQQTLARKTVDFDIERYGATNMEKWVENHYPGWRFVESKKSKFIIEEDPALKPFAYLNVRDGMVYKRGQVQGGPSLDVERLREEDEGLYWDVSRWDQGLYDFAHQALEYAYTTVHNADPESIADDETERFLHWGWEHDQVQRVIKDPGEWTAEQSTKLQAYLIPGRVSVRLTPPRPAKDSEMETGEVEEV